MTRIEEIEAIPLTAEEVEKICQKAILAEKMRRWNYQRNREYWDSQVKGRKHGAFEGDEGGMTGMSY